MNSSKQISPSTTASNDSVKVTSSGEQEDTTQTAEQ
jgi:hypothetical protein